MKSCPQCGAGVTRSRAKYCGQACARRAYNDRRIADGRLAEQRSKHADTRAAWMKTNRDRLRRAESNRRYERKRAAQKQVMAAVQSNRRSAAVRLARAASGSGPGRLFVQGSCEECGSGFVARVNNGFPRFCSKACKAKAKSQTRRARVRTSAVGRVSRSRIFKRDGWMCQICGEAVDRSAQVPHPLAPTLDHVVPLSLGGPHTEANLQLAHFYCNTLKGARAA